MATSLTEMVRPLPRAGASPRPRVLHIGKYYPPHKGGIETHLQNLCKSLLASVDLSVLVASDDGCASREIVEGVPVSRVPTTLTLSSAPLCPSMIAAIRASDADIIHLHWPNPMAIVAYLASGHPGRLVVTYHSDTIRQRLLSVLFEPFLNAALRRSAAIITTSPAYVQGSRVLRRYQDRCHVIPLGIDLAEFDRVDSAAVGALRRKYGDRVVITVGRLVYYKGFEYLIRAMAHVRGKLVIVGDGPLRSELSDLSARLGLTDKIIFAGEIPDTLVPYYRAADVFALPSIARSEAFGIVQVEAMACGLPVVNTRIESGVPFVSLDQQTGFTVPPADPNALAVAINRLLDETALRDALGHAARSRARQEFSLAAMTSRTLALYDAVLDR